MGKRVNFDEAKRIIKERINLVSFFEEKGYDLRASGSSRYVTLCPFHQEKTPSFSISETRNNWKCYGCGKSGDVFTYLMDKEGLTFPEAIEQLAEQLGLDIARDDKAAEESKQRSRLMRILADTWSWFRAQYDQLPEDHIVKAHEIREKRGISSDAKDNHMLFGWAPENGHLLLNYLQGEKYSLEDILAAGVIDKSDRDGSLYCPWRGRLMFPVCDVLGKPLGFVGRQVFYKPDEKIKRKYINSKENDVYHKRDLLFCQSIAREQARRDHELFVVEGQFDVIAMQHAGHDNTVASSGTALTEQQAQSMRRMVGADGKVIFMFDADAAGQKAALRTLALLGPIQAQSYASITEGKDPSDMYKDEGKEGLDRQAHQYIELWRHVVIHLAQNYDLTRPDQRQAFLATFKDSVWTHLNDANISEQAARLAALLSGMSYSSLIQQLGNRQHDTVEPNRDIIVTDLSHDQDLSSNPPAAALLANTLEHPELRIILSKVRMSGLDEQMRTIILESGDKKIVAESYDKDLHDYINRLDRIIDKMHEMERAAPILTDPSQLAAQQTQALLKERMQQRKESVIAKNTAAGQSMNASIARTYDDTIRQAMSHIEDVYHKNLETANELISKIADEHQYSQQLRKTNDDDYKDIKPRPYVIQLQDEMKRRREVHITESIDVNEPVFSTTPMYNHDTPFYDPSDYDDRHEDWAPDEE
jgi:DNA primase catalytic core